MEAPLSTLLSEAILPMAERLDLEHLILPGRVGKAPFGRYLAGAEAPVAEKGLSPPSKALGGYEAHPRLVEWAFGLSGISEIALDGQRYELTAGDLAIIPPLVPHLERARTPEQGYQLLWLIALLDRDRVSVHFSSYSGGKRLQLSWQAAIHGCPGLCAHFSRAAKEVLERDSGWQSLARALAVETIVLAIRGLKKQGTGQTDSQRQAGAVDLAKAYILAHYAEPLTLDEIARAAFLSPNYVSSLFTQVGGATVFEYVQQVRMAEARRLLAETQLPMREVARRVGIRARSYFSKSFKRLVGCLPREYRRRARMES